jgi:hypothetical protein
MRSSMFERGVLHPTLEPEILAPGLIRKNNETPDLRAAFLLERFGRSVGAGSSKNKPGTKSLKRSGGTLVRRASHHSEH